ncbi:DUF1697 domain-containing protein [Martelella radicis]|uniref:Uncharacterized protein (DUF1697 family) n=1 Tax=Martelella radicis TaxID=1397476 RepID=A0A7W6P8Z2_9HYPH|nr:DUF1697 domain-containing protein [Martelella radicis]MBB4121240.1 uncharacterized protein (DUF1697 family) [Martelella radicis]
MTVFIGLLRAVNVGGTGKLAMADLKALCLEAGFSDVSTYIQSGNVVFSTTLGENEAANLLDETLAAHMGKAPGVFLRTHVELAALLSACPFADKPGNKVSVFFFEKPFDPTALATMTAPAGEEAAVIGREVHVHYPEGMGRSKLKLAGLSKGTARNLNTLRKLEAMAGALLAG